MKYMKRNRQILLAALLWAAAGSFVACSQDDEVTLNRPSGAVEQTVSEASSGTRGSDSPLCTIKTDTLGQVEAKLKAYAEENSTAVSAIFNISIEGPINQTDINYLKALPYVDSLSLEKSLYHGTDGKQVYELPVECFREFKSVAAIVMPENIQIMSPLCFYAAKIRAIYMDKVEIMQELQDISLSDYSINNNVRYDDGLGYRSNFGGQFRSCTNLKVVKLSDKLAYLPAFAFNLCI